ncbi:MAG: hypothetical protein KatS3mg038_0544 [Candidatus Kapaibacterium sp.]|nr:MAG: hypothetical protein KatS3mg038_0544 [Candidatus Kapabacteria bacterium]
MAHDAYTLVVILRSTNLRHFQLMLRTVQMQRVVPSAVLYVGMPATGSALAQYAARSPLPLNVRQELVWCSQSSDDAQLNWQLLETISATVETPLAVITESDVLLERSFAESLCTVATANAIATSFSAVLSPQLSQSLDESAISSGEPFRSWWRVLRDSIVGQSRAALRIAPLRRIGDLLDRLAVRQILSSSGLAISRPVLDHLRALRAEHSWRSERELLSSAGIAYRRLTHTARHARLTETRSQIFALAPAIPAWSGAPLEVLTVRPIFHRHRLN